MHVRTLVVGGGLSGLSIASELHARGHAVHLVEARARLGGRILSSAVEHASSLAHFDLGPAWFWVFVQDWAFEPQRSSSLDHAPLRHHPDYGLPPALRELCGGRLLLASTEAAPRFGGYLEGALEAAESVVKTLDG